MEIRVLGTGCPNCEKLYKETEKVVAEMAVDADLQKVQKLDDIMAFGVMMTPAIVIDGRVMCSGRVPDGAEIAAWIADATKD